MSNCLAVRIGKTIHYYPFRWNGNEIQVWNEKNWIYVTATDEKLDKNHRVFVPFTPQG